MIVLVNFLFFSALFFCISYFFIPYKKKKNKYRYKIVKEYCLKSDIFVYLVYIDDVYACCELTLEEAEQKIENHRKKYLSKTIKEYGYILNDTD